MRILHIDCTSGMSGDMMLAGFVNMGMPMKYIQQELDKLGVSGEFQLSCHDVLYQDKHASNFAVRLRDPKAMELHPYQAKQRSYGDILEIISRSKLDRNIKELSLKIFAIKAEAEAYVHDVPLHEVQFHEPGAVDSIVDIVGTAIGFHYFRIERTISTKVPTGHGTVLCACGELKVPVPAVRKILETSTIQSYRSDTKQELLTPTGAAILAGIVNEFNKKPVQTKILGQGFSVGERATGRPPLCLTLTDDSRLE